MLKNKNFLIFIVFVFFSIFAGFPYNAFAAFTKAQCEALSTGSSCKSSCDDLGGSATENNRGYCREAGDTTSTSLTCCQAKNLPSTDAACSSAGGGCKVGSGGCSSTEDRIGACDTTDGLVYSCCKAKTSTPPLPAQPANPQASSPGQLQYTLLENIPGADKINGSDLPAYVKAVYKVALIIVTLSAVLMLSIGGFMYITSAGNTSAMGTAKGIIFDSLIGLVIALCAWLVLNVINPDLVNIQIEPLAPLGTSTSSTGGGTKPPVPVQPGDRYTHAEAVAALSAAGISVSSSGNCSNQNDSSCTSLEGIPKSAINNVISLKANSGCSFNVTGGTETGHASHGTGLPVVDVTQNSCLSNYLQSERTKGIIGSKDSISKICATSSMQPVAYNCSYVEPANHFHIAFST